MIGRARFYGWLVAAVLVFGEGISSVVAGGWYVANTAPTEWIRYQRVYFSAGTYRFTARAGSPVGGATIRLEIDNVPVKAGVVVPNTGRMDAFDYVHLGSATVTQGYHDLKVVFESADVSLDWFMLNKDPDPVPRVKPSDIKMLPSDNIDMRIAPIVAFGHMSGWTGGPAALCQNYWSDDEAIRYSDAQIEAWYGIPIYQDYDRRLDRYWDILVDELVASRAQVPLFHCRSTKDFTRGLQDRDYQRGDGHFEGRWMVKLAEAIARNPQAASSLKVGMFWENGAIADLFHKIHGYYPGWGDPALVDYVMEHHLSPWFDSFPVSMLCQPTPRRPIISLFANHPDRLKSDGRMADFVAGVRSRMQQKYGYDPLFILPKGGDVTPAVEMLGVGQCPWGVWDGPMLTPNIFKGMAWGTCCAGSRRRLDTVWRTDWDPVTNTGSPAKESPGVDNFRPRIDAAGNSVLLDSFSKARALNMRLVQQEGFTNMAEGNSIYRSYHPGWKFPNQHIAAMREYADPRTQTALFEAEGCDDYHKIVKDGNSGGSFRREWYSQGNHLDIYRPLQNAQKWNQRSVTGSGRLVQVSAGTYDVWGLTADGKIWARHVTGVPNNGPEDWKQIRHAPPLTFVSVGKEFVWGLAGTTAYSAEIPYGWDLNGTTKWKERGTMSQVSVAQSKVWGVDAKGGVFYRAIDGSDEWTQVEGTMDAVFAGNAFVWGMRGPNIYFSRVSPVSWVQVANPHGIVKLAVGGEEVWGLTARGGLYRRNIAGNGTWDAVGGPRGDFTSVSVGENHVWGLMSGMPYNCRLEGFQGAVALPPFINNAMAADGKVTLTWTAVSGATGYNIKRATTKGGSYQTVHRDIMPPGAPLSYTDVVGNGPTYFYVISALTASGETENSEEVSASPQARAPVTPANLRAGMGMDSAPRLAWVDRADNEAGFKIERKQGKGEFVPIAAVPANAVLFRDDAALSGFDYTYRVRAYNAVGESPPTVEAVVATSLRELKRVGWTATASSESPAGTKALDGNHATAWTTGKPQSGGEWFQVDMRGVNTIYQIDLFNGGGDYPRSYVLELSLDGTDWGKPVTAGSGLPNITTLTFSPQKAHYIKITQTGTTATNWLSIRELKFYGYAE
jgi:hypothetical protein